MRMCQVSVNATCTEVGSRAESAPLAPTQAEGTFEFSLADAQQLPPSVLMSSLHDLTVPWYAYGALACFKGSQNDFAGVPYIAWKGSAQYISIMLVMRTVIRTGNRVIMMMIILVSNGCA